MDQWEGKNLRTEWVCWGGNSVYFPAQFKIQTGSECHDAHLLFQASMMSPQDDISKPGNSRLGDIPSCNNVKWGDGTLIACSNPINSIPLSKPNSCSDKILPGKQRGSNSFVLEALVAFPCAQGSLVKK